MKLIIDLRGHAVYLRCVTSPPTWEAACECGYRSQRSPEQGTAEYLGLKHADKAEPWKAPKPLSKSVAKRRAAMKRGK